MKYTNSEFINEEVIHEVENNEYKDVAPKMPERTSDEFVTPEVVSELPFKRISVEDFYKLYNSNNINGETEGLECRGVDVDMNIAARAERFQSLSPSEQEIIEKSILQFANDNEEEVLQAMRLTGREADRTLADELEQKYGMNTDKVRVATELFFSTYKIWEINDLIDTPHYKFSSETEREAKILEKLKLLDESAGFLEHFQLPATHVTSSDAAAMINEAKLLRKSDSVENPWHFLGDGIYAGILGCYKDWNRYVDGEMYEFNVPLADTIPLITHFNRPRSQINILGEGLDIKNLGDTIATSTGLQQWRHMGEYYRIIDDSKVHLLEQTLGCPVEIHTDSSGIETAVADTHREPIHWAMACRALRIPRFIPKSELSKSDIAYKPSAEFVETIHKESNLELLSTGEGLKLIGQLTDSMRNVDIDAVIDCVDSLEKSSCKVSIRTSQATDAHEKNYTFNSSWTYGDNWGNYFGGGLHVEAFAGNGSLEDTITVEMPMCNMFVVADNYRDRVDRFTSEPTKAIAVLPVDTLSITMQENGIGTVNARETREASVIWRMAQSGDYSNNCFISEEQEAVLKEALGYDVRVERDVLTPDFISGEYDRLVVPRSVSVLKASSVAYTLGLMEVVYADQVEELNQHADGEFRARLAEYEYILTNRESGSQEVDALVAQVEKNDYLTELDKFLTKAYLVLEAPKQEVKEFLAERAQLTKQLGDNFPESKILEEMSPRREWFIHESSAHGTPHTLRVMTNMELLARLSGDNPSGENPVNLRSLEIATMLHDTRRHTDDSDDYDHGARAAEFMDTLMGSEYEDLLSGADLDLAKRIMTQHSLDDYEGMTTEEKLFKDADALDRYRFGSGPDHEYLRTPQSKQIDNSAKQMAFLSKFLLQNGYTRKESVIVAGRALGLLKN